jgi:CRP-like cAMP-binding protein
LQNELLAALDPDSYRGISRDLTPVSLEFGAVLQTHLSRPRGVVFPCGGVCSVINLMPDGGMVEVAMVGREGFVGMEAAIDEGLTIGQVMVQIATQHAWRMSADAYRRNLQRYPNFRTLTSRFALVYFGTIMQTTACNSLHTAEQRLARWLLMTQDRVGGDLPLTQELLSIMLGVRRPTVSVAAAMLQKIGAIAYNRGRIRIADRARLEDTACSCYHAICDLASRLVESRVTSR